MGYVIAALLVLLIVGGFVLFLVTNATKKSNVSDAGDPGADQNPMGIVGSDDETPAGDTRRSTRDVAEARRARRPYRRTRPRSRGPWWAAKPRANGPHADILDSLSAD